MMMYLVGGMVMLLFWAKNYSLNTMIAWAVVCGVVAMAYHGLLVWVVGGSHYEMLVSGNMKRRSAMNSGRELKITSYKYEKEYRIWKGFAIGAVYAVILIIGGLVLGANQGKIGQDGSSTGLGVCVLIFDLLGGWIYIPFQIANATNPYTVSYYFTCLFALLPVLVSGGLYIGGAYGKRSKRMREQEIARRAAEAEENRLKNKKINYGGLPGTKPNKRK
jgi:hypothetical protein